MNSSKQRISDLQFDGLSHNAYIQIAGVVLITPAIFLLCVILIAPFVSVVWSSFTHESLAGLTLANYRWLLGPRFLNAFKNSLFIGIVSVAIEVLVAVPLALLLNQRLPGRGFLRSAVTLPWAIPTVALAAAGLWLANTNYGIFNQVGLATGLLKAPIPFLDSPILALPTVTLWHAWKGLPLVFVIILSSLQSLPSEHLEAAKVDGAWRMAQLRYIILPHLKSSIALGAVVSGVYNFSLFDIAFLLTKGGPAGTTTTLPLLLYMQEFIAFDTNRSSAVGVIIFLAGVISLLIILFDPFARKPGR